MTKKKKKLRRYPWEQWMSIKKAKTLVRLRDYDCMTHCMTIQIRMEAKLWGYTAKIKTHEDGQSLIFKIVR